MQSIEASSFRHAYGISPPPPPSRKRRMVNDHTTEASNEWVINTFRSESMHSSNYTRYHSRSTAISNDLPLHRRDTAAKKNTFLIKNISRSMYTDRPIDNQCRMDLQEYESIISNPLHILLHRFSHQSIGAIYDRQRCLNSYNWNQTIMDNTSSRNQRWRTAKTKHWKQDQQPRFYIE